MIGPGPSPVPCPGSGLGHIHLLYMCLQALSVPEGQSAQVTAMWNFPSVSQHVRPKITSFIARVSTLLTVMTLLSCMCLYMFSETTDFTACVGTMR